MPIGSTRRFNLGDAMIFVAAAGVGTLALRTTTPDYSNIKSRLSYAPSLNMRRFISVEIGLSLFLPYLAAFTPAVLIARWRRPRPSLRRIGRQPGVMACAVATAVISIEILWIVSLLSLGSRFIHLSTVFAGYAQQVSFAVLASWITLMLSGRWRPEASWVDRLGRALGIAWIVATIISWARYFFII